MPRHVVTPLRVIAWGRMVQRFHRGSVPMKGDTMSRNGTLAAAVAAIRDALALEVALEDARRGMRGAWIAAYAATRTAQEAGQTQAAIGKAANVSPATVGDYLTAAAIPAAAWDVLDTLPARQGVRFTTAHSLVAGARQRRGTPAVRAIIADAVATVGKIPREDGAAPDADRVARVWGAAIRKLWEASAKVKVQTPPPPPPADPPADPGTGEGSTGSGEGGEGGDTAPDPATSLHARVLKLSAECGAVRVALSGGHSVSRGALVALQRETSQLARDVAAMLTPEAGKASA